MEGRQRNTMDVDYFGPKTQIGFWYMGALKAAEKMALYMKDKDFARTCGRLFTQGSQWMDRHLFNGEYYEHLQTTLQSIMKCNYRPDFSRHFNNMRSYVTGNEAGLLIAS